MHLYSLLGDAYYGSYGCIRLSRGIRRRRQSDVQLLATGEYNYCRLACIAAYLY